MQRKRKKVGSTTERKREKNMIKEEQVRKRIRG